MNGLRYVRLQRWDGDQWVTLSCKPEREIVAVVLDSDEIDKRASQRHLWRVVPVLPDSRDGEAPSRCGWWQIVKGRTEVCTRPLGHGGAHVDRINGPLAQPRRNKRIPQALG